MISIGDITFTSKDETLEAHEYFQEKHGKVAEPACHRCGAMTTYIIEPVKVQTIEPPKPSNVHPGADVSDLRPPQAFKRLIPTRKGVAAMIGLGTDPKSKEGGNRLPFMLKDDMLYIPVAVCVRCEAAQDGTECAKWHPGQKNNAMAAAKERLAMTEHQDYQRVFLLAFNKQMDKQEEFKNKSDRQRYMPKAGK